ncbi:hypothetical protein EJV47_26705 [Hymenobacter gummosus]|uniref:T9SS type A sorting domain-containing protein n=1 Tax=Hymenobacter gummosus TaxID=1776032 RepID=A0A3S0JCT2_9BACT|nr:hypothetical protein [Hymenobacter gummosus]RTQ44962.1 hypothetical protein EJV47_26705 [Hymenobacter gummosus]
MVSAPKSSTRPDNSHALLAFVANSVRYSTGVNDDLLANNGLAFTPAIFNSLPVETLNAPTSSTKAGFGQLYDGVDNGPSNPPPPRTLAGYLVDGPNGLDLGTGLANIPSGALVLTLNGINPASIGDGLPDVLVTQIASPSGSSDVFSCVDASGNVVGNTVSVVYNGSFPTVGEWLADFYEASSSPMGLSNGFTKTARDLRLWTADLSQFGITAENVSRVKQLRIQLNGDSDLAFVAYNKQSATILPVELVSFGARPAADGAVQLDWRTASERNAAAFVVEASHAGGPFAAVGEVAAAGNSTTARNYGFRHRPAAAGTWYYRLRQRDFDGKETLSEIRSVTTGKAEKLPPLSLLPNPAHDRVQVLGATAGPVELLDATGRVLRRQPAESGVGLPAGIYLVRNGRRSARLVVE